MPEHESVVPEKCKGNMSAKLLRSELKSTIPKPTPYLRNMGTTRGATSYHSQPSSYSTRIPLAKYKSADRGKTSASLQYTAGTIRNKPLTPNKYESKRIHTASRSQSPKPQSPRPQRGVRPKSAVPMKNCYANVKAKVNSKPSAPAKIKSSISPLDVHALKLDDFTFRKTVSKESLVVSHPKEEKQMSNEEVLEKRKHLLSIYSELQKLQPSKDLQPAEKEICRLMENKTIGQLEGLSLEQAFHLAAESSPEFLYTFDKKMQEVSEHWLKLLCNIISAKLVSGTITLDLNYVPDHMPNLRDEIYKCLSNVSNNGETLDLKLKWIEDEQLKAITVVLHNVMSLFKQYEELKDKHFRLEKTQDQIHFQLKEEIAILGSENKNLDKKYSLAVEKYNLEKSKTEQQEKYKYIIQKDMLEVRKVMKLLEGKCAEWETKVKKLDATCRTLEVAIRCQEMERHKDIKNRELHNKQQDFTETINQLKNELEERMAKITSLEQSNTDLQSVLDNMKVSMNESHNKRNELVEEVSTKNKKIIELEVTLDKIKSYVGYANPGFQNMESLTSNLMVEDLTRDLQQRSVQILELKKKIGYLEHSLKEAKTREDILLQQMADLQRQPLENEVALKAQIKDMHFTIKDLSEEIAELKKMNVQKTLELDQRDLLMHQHSEILRAKDELLPIIQNKQRKEKECIEKLRAVVIEQEKTYCNQNVDRFFGTDNRSLLDAMRELDSHYSVDPQMVEKELAFRQEKMAELFSLLEKKQMDIIRLERRIQELEGRELEKEFRENKTNRTKGFFSFFNCDDPQL